MKLSIGPIQYFWDRQRVLDFYERIADSSAEIIYLGEVICSKRRLINPATGWPSARELRQSGKEVILSSLTLLEAASEVSSLKKLCNNAEFMVEANDVTAIQLLSKAGKAFVTGPSVNIYNHRSLRLLARKGLKRWVLPWNWAWRHWRICRCNGPKAWKQKYLHWAVCHWPTRRAATRHVRTTCPRMTASSSAWIIRMAAC